MVLVIVELTLKSWVYLNVLYRVLGQVSCEVAQPKPNRPTEGQLFINVELSPMASPAFESGRLVKFKNNTA